MPEDVISEKGTDDTRQAVNALISSMNKAVIGQEHVCQSLIIGLLTNGHVLLEGYPGTAKTRAIKALSKGMNSSFGRIQFTPDLLPSDVTGTDSYQEIDGKPSLKFQPGPVFNNLVLADEINRAPAKVQSALLEAMAEGTLTVGGKTHQLPELFMVLATQNPIEQEGTYPLPEAQMDRFMMKVTVDYPDSEGELGVIRLVRGEELSIEEENVDINVDDILNARKNVSKMPVSDVVEHYIVSLVMATREASKYKDSKLASWLTAGVSPRASIALDKCARAHAWLNNKEFVDPDDVRAVAHNVLGHRLLLSFDAIADNISPKVIVDELLNVVVVA